MIYRYALTIPAGTSEDSAVTQVVQVSFGVVKAVSVSFPPGAAALAHTVCRYHGTQVWPNQPGTSFAWDAVTLTFPEEFPVFVPPFELELVGWSEDDTFDHTVVWRFSIIAPAVMQQIQRFLATQQVQSAVGGT